MESYYQCISMIRQQELFKYKYQWFNPFTPDREYIVYYTGNKVNINSYPKESLHYGVDGIATIYLRLGKGKKWTSRDNRNIDSSLLGTESKNSLVSG